MARPSDQNAALNCRFELAAYGVGPFITNGVFVQDRWKREGGGTASRASVAPGVTSSSVDDKWLRSQPCLDIVLDAAWSPPTDWLTIRQRVPQGDLHGEQLLRVIAILFGPAGATCKVGVGPDGMNVGRYSTVTLQGSTAGGTPIPTVAVFEEMMGDVNLTYRTIEVCRDPVIAGGGTIKVAFAQLDYRRYGEPAVPFLTRRIDQEMVACRRYVNPLPTWARAVAAAGSQVIVEVSMPVPMNAVPTIVSPAAAVDFLPAVSGTVVSSSNPSPAFDAGGHKDAYGGRIVMSNFTGAVSGNVGQIATPKAFLLEAELG